MTIFKLCFGILVLLFLTCLIFKDVRFIVQGEASKIAEVLRLAGFRKYAAFYEKSVPLFFVGAICLYLYYWIVLVSEIAKQVMTLA